MDDWKSVPHLPIDRRKEDKVTHERLRIARETKGWSLEELSRRSGIRPRTISLIENGQFAELPAGLYCRSSIRSYAAAVGLNPDQVLEALGPMLPGIEDPLDGLARRYGHARKAEPKAPPPAAPAATDTPMAAPTFAPPAAAPGEDLADILLVPVPSPKGELVDGARNWWRPVAASAIDGVLLAALGAVLVWLTAIAGATTVPVALRIGAPGMALVFALIVALYFVLFGGVGNATLGVSLMRLEARPPGRTVLHPREVFGRACRSIFHDSSVLAE
jgi:transcriptional regulator with XRE-family HTH domain